MNSEALKALSLCAEDFPCFPYYCIDILLYYYAILLLWYYITILLIYDNNFRLIDYVTVLLHHHIITILLYSIVIMTGTPIPDDPKVNIRDLPSTASCRAFYAKH